jgi:hypothetical protein
MQEVFVEEQKFHNLLSVLQLKSASNSLLIFADSRQDKRACCPNFKHNTPSSNSFRSGNVSLLSPLSKSLYASPKECTQVACIPFLSIFTLQVS